MSAYTCFASHYDALTANVSYPKRAEYFDRIIRENMENPRLLLDLACGTGSLSLALSGLGYEVIGVDGSSEMLSVAMQKSGEAGRDILFLNQPMDKLDLYGTVDVTVCALDSINHLPDDETLSRVFKKIALFTNPGGLFIFDVNTAYKHRELLAQNTYVIETPTVCCVWQNHYKNQHDTVDIALDFFVRNKDGSYRRERERFRERIFDDELLRSELHNSGFKLLNVYHEDSLEPPKVDTQRIVYVAKKI